MIANTRVVAGISLGAGSIPWAPLMAAITIPVTIPAVATPVRAVACLRSLPPFTAVAIFTAVATFTTVATFTAVAPFAPVRFVAIAAGARVCMPGPAMVATTIPAAVAAMTAVTVPAVATAG